MKVSTVSSVKNDREKKLISSLKKHNEWQHDYVSLGIIQCEKYWSNIK